MELRHLRYFVAVARERSMSRAAEHLHMTQPSLSRQIRQLEREIGAELFERTSTGTTLTAAGVALHQHALLLLRLADASKDAARSASERTREAVSIGLPPGLAGDWVLRMLTSLRAELPHVAVTITEASSTDQLSLVREGTLDLGLVHERPPMLRGARLFGQPFGVAVRAGHPLAHRRTCRTRDLDNVRVLAHAREQVSVAHDRLIVAVHDTGAVPLWRFAQFSEHALACVEATEADAVLLTEESARRLLPDWPWLPVSEPAVELVTWLVWQPETRNVVERVAELVRGLDAEAS